MKSILVTLISLFPLFVSAQSSTDSLTNELKKAYDEGALQGFSVALVDQDGVFFTQSYGFADIKSQRPYTSSTYQPIGSISKTFLGVSLMKAQELGMLKLDDDINKYLPFQLKNPNHPKEVITLRHLATHSSSIKDTEHYDRAYIFSEKLDADKFPGLSKTVKLYNSNKNMPLTDFLKKIYTKEGEWYSKKNFAKKASGETYIYSNNGAALAALVVENASGMAYDEFVKKHILDPLGMELSNWKMANTPADKRATLYVDDIPLPTYELLTYADGGFVTSVEEFSKYFVAIINGHLNKSQPLLTPKSFKEMLTPHHESDQKPGIFWVAGDKRIGHTGGDPGVMTVAFFNRKDPVGVIVFTNTTPTKNGSEQIGNLFKLVSKYSYGVRDESH